MFIYCLRFDLNINVVVVILSIVIMEGYDVMLIGNFYGYFSFCEKYGEWFDDESGY